VDGISNAQPESREQIICSAMQLPIKGCYQDEVSMVVNKYVRLCWFVIPLLKFLLSQILNVAVKEWHGAVAIRMLGVLCPVDDDGCEFNVQECNFQVDLGTASIEPAYIQDFFNDDRIVKLHRFTEATVCSFMRCMFYCKRLLM
jgi:hypothetical protein